MGLVEYDSGSDSGSETVPVVQHTEAPQKPAIKEEAKRQVSFDFGRLFSKSRKRLPTLPESYIAGVAPNDDPALHQGRKRTRPFVLGDYDTHVYIVLPIPSRLSRSIRTIVDRLRSFRPGVEYHSFLDKGSAELHISLTHPFPLRRSQINDFKAALIRSLLNFKEKKDNGDAGGSFIRLSLGGEVKVYYNGRKYGGEGHGGRAFFALRVTAGSAEIDRMVENVVHPLLSSFHRPLYHSNPEYHASFAWCLSQPPSQLQEDSRRVQSTDCLAEGDVDTQDVSSQPVDDDLLRSINEEFEEELLRSQPKEGWTVDRIILKTGKDLTEIPL